MGLIQSAEGLIKQQADLSQARRKAAADKPGLDLYQLIPCLQPGAYFGPLWADFGLPILHNYMSHFLIRNQTVMLKKTPGSILDCKEIKPVNPKGNQR